MADAPDVLTMDPARPPSRVPDILRQTQPWVRLVSVIYFVMSTLMIAGGIIGGVVLAFVRSRSDAGAAGALAAIPLLIVYPVIGLFNLIPAVLLGRFARRAREFVASGQPHQLEDALDAQRSYWKFMGVLMIIGMAIMVVALVVAVVAGVFFARA
jgi:hypothetical protein